MLPECFFTFVLVRFFSLPLIFTWLAASISHFVTANFHVFYQRNSAPLFLSNTLALSLFSTSVKTLQFRKSESTLSLLFFFSLKSRGEGAGMQFRAKKPRVTFGLAYLSIQLFYIGKPVVRTERLRSRHYQIFSVAQITKFCYPRWSTVCALRARELRCNNHHNLCIFHYYDDFSKIRVCQDIHVMSLKL